MGEYMATYENRRNGILTHRRVTAVSFQDAVKRALYMAYSDDALMGVRVNNPAVFPDLPVT